MEFNRGKTGKGCDSPEFLISKSHRKLGVYILGAAGQVEPCRPFRGHVLETQKQMPNAGKQQEKEEREA